MGWGDTRTHPGFLKKFSNPSQTRLLKLNVIPLGRGGYPKRPAPLPPLVIPLTFENLKSIDTIKSIYAYRKICILLALPYMDRTIKIPR